MPILGTGVELFPTRFSWAKLEAVAYIHRQLQCDKSIQEDLKFALLQHHFDTGLSMVIQIKVCFDYLLTCWNRLNLLLSREGKV